ncbi:hypothetical protein BU16DRAFT_565769 [Lophium mytilinum]|uniref:Uncharacterized protein n=1 Tax=Lophium mytilinum TaxID=390894 RepID=A0A6A6QEX5_9PEZI|nr:hypothetical protein BU16DRAFT_565769 [Lophium mytilinum]
MDNLLTGQLLTGQAAPYSDVETVRLEKILPFLDEYHRDNVPLEEADEKALVTQDGSQLHNLDRDILYIPDPSLAFVGTAYSVSTFPLFEFQAIAVAAVFAGSAGLPKETDMRAEYAHRVLRKGLGRSLHELGDEEVPYVNEIVSWLNRDGKKVGAELVEGHKPEWIAESAGRKKYAKEVFARARLPQQTDIEVLSIPEARPETIRSVQPVNGF